jgi:hypothetical protein
MSDNTLDVNAEYLRQQANFEHEDYLEGLQREQEMRDADVDMMPVRKIFADYSTEYHNKINKDINTEKDKILKYALNRSDGLGSIKDIIAERTPFDNKRIQSLTKRTTGGKSRVFRKKSNKTKKVSRRNRRSRNIRRSRNSRAHKHK